MKFPIAVAILACGLLVAPAFAQDPPEAEQGKKVHDFVGSLHFQTGDIALDKPGAHLHVQDGFRFLGHDDGRRVLEQLWGNPPDDTVLGLLVPDDANLESEHSWAVLVTYSDDGYVSDEDASKIDYTKILADMKEQTTAENEDRKKAGFDSVNLVGWAQPPHYDPPGRRIYWAKELDFAGTKQHTLNYDIRVLGREGYLSMNAIANISDLELVRAGMTRVLPMAEFDPGHRYADYQPGHDKLAAYGLAALVGGGLAAKAGLFAKLGIILLAAKKFVILAFLGIAAFVKKLFGGKKGGGGTVR